MPRSFGLKHNWLARTDEVDFLRNNGGLYAVTVTLDKKKARKLGEVACHVLAVVTLGKDPDVTRYVAERVVRRTKDVR